MFSAVIFASLLSVNYAKLNQYCPKDGTLVPSHFDISKAAKKAYPFVEGGLQIFRNRRIGCDGFLTYWFFIAQDRFVYDTHLAVFRERYQPNSLLFDVIGETFIEMARLPDRDPNMFDLFKATHPIAVKEGDFLGLFYKRMGAGNGALSILSEHVDNSDNGTHVLILDALQGVGIGSFINATVNSHLSYRNPALTAYIVPNIDDYYPDNEPSTPPTFSTDDIITAQSTTEESLPITLETPAKEADESMPSEGDKVNTVKPAQIPSRCLHDTPTSGIDNCLVKQPRIYFDFDNGECRTGYSCWSRRTFSDNDFESIQQCQEVCFSLLPSLNATQAVQSTEKPTALAMPTRSPVSDNVQALLFNQLIQRKPLRQLPFFLPSSHAEKSKLQNIFNAIPEFLRQQHQNQQHAFTFN